MSRSVRAIYQSPYSRYKASQLTQESNFAISVVEDLKILWNSGTNYTNAIYDLGAAITRTGVHLQLSNSFEQWRINSVTIKFQLKTFSGDVLNLYEDVDITEYLDFYTVVRRSTKTTNTLEELESNSSFEQVTWPANGLGPCAPLKRTIHNSSLRMASTKMTAPFPFIVYGLKINGPNHFLMNKMYQSPFVVSMQLQAKCSYKGVRLDKSNVLTSINPNVIPYSRHPTWEIPTLSKLIYTKGIYGPDPDEQVDLMKKTWQFTNRQQAVVVAAGRAVCIITSNTIISNLYNIYASRAARSVPSTTFYVPANCYYCPIEDIFNGTSATAMLYLYSENDKLIATTNVPQGTLTHANTFNIHVNLQKLNDRVISQ